MRTAIAGKQLHLLYQPVIDLQTGRICSVEALVRWEEQDAQGVSTPYLIEVAEESGLIAGLGEWVVRRACADLLRRDEMGLPRFPVALNISRVELQNPLYAENLARLLEEAGAAPDAVSVEVTEAAIVQGGAIAMANLEKLKNIGVALTLDDFGTGFSSLSHLKSLPFARVKIDRSFIKQVPDNGEDTAISRAIISMAHSLGIRVVAEGVETEAQCGFLSQNMCDEMQGFFFSDALGATALEELMRQDPVLPEKLLRLQKPRRTLLLVDDEGNIVNALKRLLRTHDFRILTANSGQAGLEVLTQNPVDVIISDQRMPGMTGVEFLGKAKELYPDTVRIVLSGYTELHSVTDAVNQGAIYKFLTKPWDDEQLVGHIQEAFRHKGMADENRRLNLEVLTANQELAQANRRLEDLLQQKQQQIMRDEMSLDIVREALQQIPLAVIAVDDSDLIVFANDEAQALFEDAPSILGCDVNQLIPDLEHATVLGSRGSQCTIEIGRRFFEVVSRRMGRGSQSRGKLMTISPFKALS
ncbi:MAG TPA: EAL domain-containing protein [Burkholderiaceae bacterium]